MHTGKLLTLLELLLFAAKFSKVVSKRGNFSFSLLIILNFEPYSEITYSIRNVAYVISLLQDLNSKLKDTAVLIEEKLDEVLSVMCINFDHDRYSKITTAYLLLGLFLLEFLNHFQFDFKVLGLILFSSSLKFQAHLQFYISFTCRFAICKPQFPFLSTLHSQVNFRVLWTNFICTSQVLFIPELMRLFTG